MIALRANGRLLQATIVRSASAPLIASLLLASCGADTLSTAPQLTANSGAAGDPYPSVSAESVDESPNPFSDPHAKPPGGREVIDNPTTADIFAASPLAEMAWGSATAPVTIVEYASLTCPHCRRFHLETFPAVKQAYIDTGKLRFVLREFPIGRQSGNATIALRCAKSDRYLDLYGKFMAQQANWVSQEVRLDPIFAVAQQVGVTRPEFDACLKDQKLIDGLKWVKERGRKLGVIGTPNFFVGERLVKTVLSFEDVKAAVDAAAVRPLAAGAR